MDLDLKPWFLDSCGGEKKQTETNKLKNKRNAPPPAAPKLFVSPGAAAGRGGAGGGRFRHSRGSRFWAKCRGCPFVFPFEMLNIILIVRQKGEQLRQKVILILSKVRRKQQIITPKEYDLFKTLKIGKGKVSQKLAMPCEPKRV